MPTTSFNKVLANFILIDNFPTISFGRVQANLIVVGHLSIVSSFLLFFTSYSIS